MSTTVLDLSSTITLPSLGEGVESGTIISILVNAGDEVSEEQSLIEVETDKVTVEVPCTSPGTVKEILVGIGEEIKVGQPILSISSEKESENLNSGEEIPKEIVTDEQELQEIRPEAKEETTAKPPAIQNEKVNKEIKLPSLGEGISQGTVIALLVKVGDTIHEEQSIVEVETDKVTVEVPSEEVGVVKEILIQSGEEVEVGQTLIILESGAIEKEKPTITDRVPSTEEPETIAKEKPENIVVPVKPEAPTTKISKGRAPASPLAKVLAREIGVHIHEVKGSGHLGRISVKDVKTHARFLNQQKSTAVTTGINHPPLPDFSQWGLTRKEKLPKIGQATSKNMTSAWSQIPHAWLQEKADITQLEAQRQLLKGQAKEKGGSLTVTAILVQIVADVLNEFPLFNSSFDSASQEIIYKEYVHVGVAVDTPKGLLVPSVRDANKKTLLSITQDLKNLSEKARDNKLTMDDLQGGTFTISNLGGIGTTGIFPIVNHPQVAILGISASQTEPVWVSNMFQPRLFMPMTLGFDHRIINGADAARFLKTIQQKLENSNVHL